jgi:osmotically-inducible protein OsmY
MILEFCYYADNYNSNYKTQNMAPTTSEYIKKEIIDQLVWDNSVNANEILVSVSDGAVKLRGRVPTYASKIAAEKNAWSVEGVNRVENLLEVELPPDTARPSDTEITRSIENKLVWNSEITSANISIQTTDGIVSLNGTVDSFWQKSLAEDVAHFTRGVVDVVNNLAVSVTKSVIDIDIESDIKSTMKRSGLTGGHDITVSVANGIVRLSGTVPNHAVKKQAKSIAMYTAGVIDVIDDVVVG